MAFTGDLEHLPIVDIIQLVHTTRKSGIFFVKGDKGESKLVFSNGSIVGANHVSDRIRIGTVLVKMGAITVDDLKQALNAQKDATDRPPLMVALIQMGKLKQDDAQRGLKKLVEMTIVELMGWTKGTFTFDTDTFVFDPEKGAASFGDVQQNVGVDAQMILMDALRIFDERERDRAKGKEVPPFETIYTDVLPGEGTGGKTGEQPTNQTITADDLGLGDLDRLERKIPKPVSEMAIFDPVEIHRQNIREILAGFSSAEQELLVSYLGKSVARKPAADVAIQQAGKAVVIFSNDKLIRHSVMTICKEDGVPVFATDDAADLERLVSQCLFSARTPVVVFDNPDGGLSGEKVVSLRTMVRGKYGTVPVVQFASLQDSNFIFQSYRDGVRAVLPKPLQEVRRETYIQETIKFLDTFKSYIKGYQDRIDTTDRYVKELKDNIKLLREITTPSDAAMVILAGVAEIFERAVTFFVRPSELIGERAVGVSAEKSAGPMRADNLKIPLSKPSVFRDVLEKGLAFYGESNDETLKDFLKEIGLPLSPAVILLPLMSDRKVVAMIYGDFGKKNAAPVQLDILEILAQQAGIVLEYALFRRQVTKAAQS